MLPISGVGQPVSDLPGQHGVRKVLHTVHYRPKLGHQIFQPGGSYFVAHLDLFDPELIIVAMELVPVRIQCLHAGREQLEGNPAFPDRAGLPSQEGPCNFAALQIDSGPDGRNLLEQSRRCR